MFNDINKINNLTNYYKNTTGNYRRGYDRLKSSLNPKSSYRQRNTLSDFNINSHQNNFLSSKREISLNTNESSISSNKSIFESFKHSNFLLTDYSKNSNMSNSKNNSNNIQNSNSKNNSNNFQKSNSNTKIFQDTNLNSNLIKSSKDNIFKNPHHYSSRKSFQLTLPYNYKNILKNKESEREKEKEKEVDFFSMKNKIKELKNVIDSEKDNKNENNENKTKRKNSEIINRIIIPNPIKETITTNSEEEQKDFIDRFKEDLVRGEFAPMNDNKSDNNNLVNSFNTNLNKEKNEKIRRLSSMFRRVIFNTKIDNEPKTRKKFEKKVIPIQRFWRNWYKNVYLKKTIQIQSYYRGYSVRNKINFFKNVINIQKLFKGYLVRRKISDLKGLILIESFFRGFFIRKYLFNLRKNVFVIQRIFRGEFMRRKIKDMRKNSIFIQKYFRRFI